MRKLISLLLVAAFLPLLVLTSCRKDEDPDPAAKTEYELLTEYATDNSLDLGDILDGWVTSGSGLAPDPADEYSIESYYIMDLRSPEDFGGNEVGQGHIKGAINVAFGDILTAAASADKPILCVCYTGQTAARATGLLRLAGYTDTKSLKWGMCGWNQNFEAKWETNAVDYDSTNWTTTGDPAAMAEFDTPSLSTGKTTGDAILADRITAAMALPWTVSKTDVLTTPTNYFINNKWSQTSWDTFGHITGAYRIDTAEGLGIAGLKNLNAAETVVTYCYTGQTSAITTAWLQVMGVDSAKSLLFGANGITHTALAAVGSAVAGKSWKGEGSASELNYGYINSDGYQAPTN